MLRLTPGNTLLRSLVWPVLDSDTGLGSEPPPSLQLRRLYLVMPFLSPLPPPTPQIQLLWGEA